MPSWMLTSSDASAMLGMADDVILVICISAIAAVEQGLIL